MQTTTPLMKQYQEIKQRFSDTLVFFQVGDFYELFFEDAKTAAAFLGIALTKRGKNNGEPIPLCGVPVHALDHYLTKLVRGGFKVALCDQLEPATPGKVVDRGVTRVFTPGTLMEQSLLDAKRASYLFSFVPLPTAWGLLFGELLTAQLYATLLPSSGQRMLESELVRFFPDEVLLPASCKQYQSYFKELGYFTSLVDADQSAHTTQVQLWMEQFRPDTRAYIANQDALRLAINNFYAYVRTTHEASLPHFTQLHVYKPEDFLLLDPATQRNLELVKSLQDGGQSGTLFSVLDNAVTAMGSRTIKKWLLRPLIKQETIVARHDVVEFLVHNITVAQRLKEYLSAIGDLERVVGRIATSRAQLQDYAVLAQALAVLPQLRNLLCTYHITFFAQVVEQLGDFTSLQHLLETALNDDPTKEWIIKQGFDERLDAIRALVFSGHQQILELEQREQQATGIGSLKVRYNNIHGYAIEITKTHYDAVPPHYIRRQTLVGRERFTTPELQQLEQNIAQARSDILVVEQEIFATVKRTVAGYVSPLRKVAYMVAYTDALLAFATIAADYKYVRPQLSTSRDIIIKQGRHPVVERVLGTRFIPNDTQLTDEQSLWIITGPNMGGKSTYLRQVSLIAIMAQCGSFVPAAYAQLPILDRIFTRIGAGDNVVGGKSTFMVEMEETAAICTQATARSLVILDEVGRGTSTFDGLALAQAVVEHIYTVIGARSLFATHYHELTALEKQFPGIVSYYAANTKTTDGIVFLYKMVRGVADGSFGIEVAKRASLPSTVILRAEQIVQSLAHEQHPLLPAQKGYGQIATLHQRIAHLEGQLGKQKTIIETFRLLDYDNLTPKQALDIIWSLKEQH